MMTRGVLSVGFLSGAVAVGVIGVALFPLAVVRRVIAHEQECLDAEFQRIVADANRSGRRWAD